MKGSKQVMSNNGIIALFCLFFFDIALTMAGIIIDPKWIFSHSIPIAFLLFLILFGILLTYGVSEIEKGYF